MLKYFKSLNILPMLLTHSQLGDIVSYNSGPARCSILTSNLPKILCFVVLLLLLFVLFWGCVKAKKISKLKFTYSKCMKFPQNLGFFYGNCHSFTWSNVFNCTLFSHITFLHNLSSIFTITQVRHTSG